MAVGNGVFAETVSLQGMMVDVVVVMVRPVDGARQFP